MIRLALAIVLAATPAIAGPERMTLHPGADGCFAVIAIENRAGRYTAVETLETDYGPVSVRYETVGGHNPQDHDIVDVVDLPPGVMALPMHIDLPDGETGHVCLMEAVVG